MKLSLAMIVKNEAEHLGHCLASVQGLVDEIVVVDTGSTDATVAVARAHGAKVSFFPWVGDFSAARNESLAQATGDWVLVLDADEAIDPVDFSRIRQACAQDSVSGFLVLIRNYLPDGNRLAMDDPAKPNPGGYTEGAGHAFCGDSRILRLFRRLPGLAYRGRLHELVEPFFQERHLALGTLDAVIHHYGQTLAARVETKKAVYLALAEQDARERPTVLESHYNLVLQAMAAEAWATACAAVAELRRHFPQEPPAVTFVHGLALHYLDRPEAALAEFDRLLRKTPGHSMGFIWRGVALASLGQHREARKVFEQARQRYPDLAMPIVHLADLEAKEGQPGAARALLTRGLERFPGDADLWSRLVTLSVATGNPEEAVRDAWAAIQHCPGGGAGTWHQLVGLALLQQGAAAQGRAVLQLGLQAFPGHPGLTRLLEGL